MITSPNLGKTSTERRHASPVAPVAWRDVLAVLQSDGMRLSVIERYRSAGFSPDDFASSRGARTSMAEIPLPVGGRTRVSWAIDAS